MPPPGTDEIARDQAFEILDKVSLDFFVAEPDIILPFGSSLLKWKVKGPDGFKVRINSTIVAKTGSKTIQPKSSQIHRLYAFVGNYSKFLGNAAINVNLSACISRENGSVKDFVKFALQREIDEDSKLYFRLIPKRDQFGSTTFVRSEPDIIVTPGRIRFILKIGKDLNNFPDASIDIDASFGLTVVNEDSIADFGERKVVPFNIDVKVDISVPWYAWLIPGAAFGLAIALDMARDSTTKRIRESSISRLVNEAILPSEPEGLEPHSVRIEPGFSDPGVVEVTFCPTQPPVVIG